MSKGRLFSKIKIPFFSRPLGAVLEIYNKSLGLFAAENKIEFSLRPISCFQPKDQRHRFLIL